MYRELSLLKDFGFKDQITRSALSIPSNIAEGFEKDYTKEKLRFLAIAKGSLGEFVTQVEIGIGIDIDYIKQEVGVKWIKEGEELSKTIGKMITNLKY
ncbi:four helix bundle protein [Aliikangiella maris]|uniref:Four helix bundle protein n=2 Tax=Aliikangiella maris TaxID=3162458 RepID=A0ABV3MHZ7_9GAMM